MSNKNKEEMQSSHSNWYNRLSEEDKNVADAILGYLNGFNYQKAEHILYVLTQEIGHCSTIHS